MQKRCINHMKLVQFGTNFINPSEITNIKLKVRGYECGACFDKQYDYYVTLVLTCGTRFRIPHSYKKIFDLLADLGINRQ